MAFVLGLAQCCHPEGRTFEDVLVMADAWCDRAKAAGVDLLVFPESMMTRYEVEHGAFLEAAQPIDGPFACGMNELAAKHGLWLVYTVNERNDDGGAGVSGATGAAADQAAAHATGNPYNTAVLVDATGRQQGVYRKVHLFDTDFTRESDRMAGGSALFEPVDTPFGKIGLTICYDLRFPEAARFAALRGCQLLINPAAWVSGNLKAEQWRTLLAARAIENEMFVAGVSRVDAGYIGQSAIFSPDGVMLASGGSRECLVTARIDFAEMETVRAAMPVLQHRRPDLYTY